MIAARTTYLLRHILKRQSICRSSLLGLAMFIEDIDSITGERRWRVADDDYDLAQEIARSGFADMLHDKQRNEMFDRALHTVINEVHQRGEQAHVVDIGAGTGLLSLMAARAGAERVTAIEVFKPMADCARKIISSSKYASIIELLNSRSTDLSSGDVDAKGNIIVAEVFDTELIGEGALRTFKEAHKTLVRNGSRVIPSLARVWIAPVESAFLEQFRCTPSCSFETPFADCPGAAAVFDVQLSQVPRESIKMLSDPFVAFRFNFEDGDSIEYNESLICEFTVASQGISRIDAILMWWDLDMDGTGEHILSMAPSWWNPNAQWRDHWMQAVYYLPKTMEVSNGQNIPLRCSHDEFSMWFAIEENTTVQAIQPPVCSCNMHVACSRNAIYRMNELDKHLPFIDLLKKECSNKRVLCINEGSFIGLTASTFAETVALIEPNPRFRSALHAYCRHNAIENVHLLATEDEFCGEVDLILSEPFFLSSMLPWNNLRFWYAIERLKVRCGPNVRILPEKGVLYGMGVHLDHLWKISAPVGCVEGFDLQEFDKVSQKARSAADAIVEPQPLWEYDSTCTTETKPLATFHLEQSLPQQDLTFTGEISLLRKGTNAIVFWMEWNLGDYCMRSGLLEKCKVGERPKWSIAHRQGVFFFPREKATDKNCMVVHSRITFYPSDGNIRFGFSF